MTARPRPPAAPSAFLVVLFASLGAFAPASVALALPGMPAMARELGVGPGFAEHGLAAFFAMLSVGMLIYGPLSDRWGRRPVLLCGLALYVAASAACVLADRAEVFVAARALQALGGAAAIVLARAIVHDLFPPVQMARMLSFMVPVAALVPLLSPLLGQWLLAQGGWRPIFAVQAGFGLACLVAAALVLAESLPPERRRPMRPAGILAAYGAILRDRTAAGHMLCGSAVYGAMMAYVGGSPAAYMGHHGVDSARYGLLFALGVGCVVTGALINARLVRRWGTSALLAGGTRGAALCALAVAVVGATDVGGLPALVAALLGFLTCCGFVGSNALTNALSRCKEYAGTAAALFGTVQFAMGGLANLTVGALSDGSPAAMGATMAAAGALAALGNLWSRGGAAHRAVP